MEDFNIYINIVASLLTSIIAGLLLHKYLRYRNEKIRKQIDEINSNEEFITKLSKSTVKLQRTSFMTILTALALFFGCLAFLLGSLSLNLSDTAMKYVYAICSWFLIVAGGICFKQAQSIVDSANLNEAKYKLDKKRDKLEKQVY